MFVQAQRAEAGQHEAEVRHSGCFLWDTKNFYEHVGYEKLWDRADASGFNMARVAAALNTYSAHRFLGLGELATDCGFPHKGIAAGCSWATTWVQVYSIPPLRIWQEHHPRVELGLFIDDFMGATTAAQEHQVVGRLTASATELR